MSYRRKERRACLVLLWAFAASCGAPTGPDVAPQDDGRPDVRIFVTEALASLLDSAGHFAVLSPVGVLPYPAIDPDQARALAVGFVNTFGETSAFRAEVSERRGGPIRPGHLKPLARVEFASTPFGSLDGLETWVRKTLGPVFYVRFTDNGEPMLTVAVSAYAIDVGIADGRLVFPASYGGEFSTFGIPPQESYQFPLSPEQAVKMVAEETGARVDSVPALIRGGHPTSRGSARWRIHLDRDVSVRMRTSGEVRVARVLFVGLDDEGPRRNVLSVPSVRQPAVDTIFTSIMTVLSLDPQIPVLFEAIVMQPNPPPI